MNRNSACCSSIKDLSEYLLISYTEASCFARDPSFPKIIFGGRKVFPKAQVKAWMIKKSLCLSASLTEQVEETFARQYNTERSCV